jgi:hypothetical protein
MIEGIINYVIQVCLITVEVIALLVLPGIIIGSILQLLTSKLRNKTGSMIGYKFFIYFTFLGTVVHELGHAFFCKVFRHKIVDIKLFSPTEDGTLGYVSHEWNPNSRYQRIGNFYIGIGPIWFGTFMIYIITKLLFPELLQELEINPEANADISFVENCWLLLLASFKGLGIFFSGTFLIRWQMYIWLYLTLSIGFHLTLSPADIKGATTGLLSLVKTILIINIFTAWMETPLLLWFGDFRSIYGILLFTLVLVFIACIILFMVRMFKIFNPLRKPTVGI